MTQPADVRDRYGLARESLRSDQSDIAPGNEQSSHPHALHRRDGMTTLFKSVAAAALGLAALTTTAVAQERADDPRSAFPNWVLFNHRALG